MTYPGEGTDISIAAHNYDDTDSRAEAHHHTIGNAPTQVASGAHDHDGTNSMALSQIAINQILAVLMPTGMIILWIGAPSTLPAGWVILDGATYNISAYPNLAKHLGFVTGSTFTVPNFQSRVPAGVDAIDAAFKPEGITGGAKTVLGGTHGHTLSDNGYAQVSMIAGSPSLLMRRIVTPSWNASVQSVTPVVAGSSASVNGGPGLGGATDQNNAPATSVVQPYIAVRFLIKA